MALFRIDRESLLKSLQAVDGIIEPNKKQTMPILANTRVTIEDNKISFLGSDLELEIKAIQDIPSEYQQEGLDLAFTVEAHKFLSIVKALPEKSVIDLTLSDDDEKLTVKSGSSKYNLQTLPAEDFPIITNRRTTYEEDDDDNTSASANIKRSVMISFKELRHLLNRVNYAMAVADMRAYLNGVFFEFAENRLNVVATDGHRLGFISTEHIDGDDINDSTFILPRKAVLELIKLIPQNASDNQLIVMSIENNSVTFELNLNEDDSKADDFTIVFVSKLIEGRFPDYKRVIPQSLEQSVLIPRQYFIKALQRASILADKRFNGTKLEFSTGVLEVVAKNSEQEEAREEVNIDLTLEDKVDIGFNIKYLLEVLNNLDCTEVSFNFTGQNAPGMFTIPEDDSFKYVVMPMRL